MKGSPKNTANNHFRGVWGRFFVLKFTRFSPGCSEHVFRQNQIISLGVFLFFSIFFLADELRAFFLQDVGSDRDPYPLCRGGVETESRTKIHRNSTTRKKIEKNKKNAQSYDLVLSENTLNASGGESGRPSYNKLCRNPSKVDVSRVFWGSLSYTRLPVKIHK